MYFDPAEGMVFRPPSEARSLILRVTIGCSHNRCTFCSMYRSVQFRPRPLEEVKHLIEQAAREFPTTRRIFLADGNALVLPTERLLTIMGWLHESFPHLTRITLYGGPQDILRKTPEELATLKAAGLKIIYLGLESGDEAVLALLGKGATPSEMIQAGQKVVASGLKLSMMVILGAGGIERSREHAIHTAAVVSAIEPTMLSALTLMLHEGTELRALAEAGKFTMLSPSELMTELALMLEHIDVKRPCIFRSNHVSNLLPLAGTLPEDKEKLLATAKAMVEQFQDRTLPKFNDTGRF
ncbi:MAG: radical SAM protein [Sporomusaceae bacterium]|nr:radical SAM protein [Sporomusaceae bacterium]